MLASQIVAPKPEQQQVVDGFVSGMVSVIMPAYNEAGVIARSIRDVKRMFQTLGLEYEIILVDDGSIDGTSVVAEDLRESNVRVIRLPRNRGKGFAFKSGFNSAIGEFVFLIDSDSEIHPRDLRRFVDQLENSDIAIGSKRHPESRVETPVLRKFLSIGLQLLARLSTGVRASDTQAGFKAARSSAVYRILPLMSVKRFAFDIEFLTIASMLDCKIVELPVEIKLGKMANPNKVFRTFIDLAGITYRLRIRHWYQHNIESMTATYNPILRWH